MQIKTFNSLVVTALAIFLNSPAHGIEIGKITETRQSTKKNILKEVAAVKQLIHDHSTYQTLCTDNQSTKLCVAADHGYTQAVDYFIKKGANVNCKDHHGHTPLIGSVLWGHQNTAAMLLKHGANEQLDLAIYIARTDSMHAMLTAAKKNLHLPLDIKIPQSPSYAEMVIASNILKNKNEQSQKNNEVVTPTSIILGPRSSKNFKGIRRHIEKEPCLNLN